MTWKNVPEDMFFKEALLKYSLKYCVSDSALPVDEEKLTPVLPDVRTDSEIPASPIASLAASSDIMAVGPMVRLYCLDIDFEGRGPFTGAPTQQFKSLTCSSHSDFWEITVDF